MKQFLLYIIFFMPYLSIAQSKEAYTKAGDKCLLMHDAFTAIQHYQAALEYDEEDAALHFKLSSAFLEVSDYSNALFQSEKTRSLTNKSSLKQDALYRSVDLLKRMGRFDDAVQLVSAEQIGRAHV